MLSRWSQVVFMMPRHTPDSCVMLAFIVQGKRAVALLWGTRGAVKKCRRLMLKNVIESKV